MLTLYHAPQSRSSRIVTLLYDLDCGEAVEIVDVTIPRRDGSGGRDPKNPHPEGKVPLLVHDGQMIRESAAIITHLCAIFPKNGLAPEPGTPEHGVFLAWMAYYAGVMEPVFVAHAAGLDHPLVGRTWRGIGEMAETLAQALDGRPYLMGDEYSAADLLLASPFAWFRDAVPDHPAIRAWVDRTQDRDSVRRTQKRDATAAA